MAEPKGLYAKFVVFKAKDVKAVPGHDRRLPRGALRGSARRDRERHVRPAPREGSCRAQCDPAIREHDQRQCAGEGSAEVDRGS